MLGGIMSKRAEYFVACTSIEVNALKRERIQIGTATASRKGLAFRTRKQLGAQTLTAGWRINPKSSDMEPTPINLAIDSTEKHAAWTSRDDAKAFDCSVAGALNV